MAQVESAQQEEEPLRLSTSYNLTLESIPPNESHVVDEDHSNDAHTPLTKHTTKGKDTRKKLKNGQKYQSITNSPTQSSSSSINTAPLLSPNRPQRKWYLSASNWLKIVIIIGLLTVILLTVLNHQYVLSESRDFLDWMSDHVVAGSFAYIGVTTLCSICMIPGSIFALGAGFVYVRMYGQIIGVVISSIVVWIAGTMGASCAFLNGRYLFRSVVLYYTAKSRKFELIDTVIGMNGFKVVLLLRLSPITPYNVFNYFMALTSVKFTDYFFACIGMIPDAIVYCFIGGSIASIAKLSSVGFASHPILLIFTIVGSVVAVVGVVYISYVAKKEFNKMAAQSQSVLHSNTYRNGLEVSQQEQQRLALSVDVDRNLAVEEEVTVCHFNSEHETWLPFKDSMESRPHSMTDDIKESKANLN